jgi:ankyrin repeat protein
VDKYGRTDLHYAARDGNAGRCVELIEAGADPSARDDDGWSALHFAAQANSADVVHALAFAGAEVDARDYSGNTPLFRAVFSSSGEGAVIVALRALGADPWVANNHGVSPISLARKIANYDVAQFFRDLPDDNAA